MKKDKRLQAYADKTMEQYKNDDLLHKLIAMQESKRKEKVRFYKTKLFKTACVSFASIVLVVAITLCAIFLPPKGNDDEDLPPVNNEQSQGGDIPTLPQEPIVPPVEPPIDVTPTPPTFGSSFGFLSKACSLEEIVTAFPQLSFVEERVTSAFIVYDPVSELDINYFVNLESEDGLASCILYIMIDPYYNPIRNETNATLQLLGKEFEVNIETEDCGDGIYCHTAYAEYLEGDVRIQIKDYVELSLSEENNFKSFIESIVSIDE